MKENVAKVGIISYICPIKQLLCGAIGSLFPVKTAY